jgi:hypothetical protein
MKFTYGSDVSVYIDLTIQVTGLFPADGDYQITENIAALFDGNNLADDVIYFQIPGAVYLVPGAIIQSLTIGTAPAPSGTSNISMGNSQRASLDVTRDGEGVITASNLTITHG